MAIAAEQSKQSARTFAKIAPQARSEPAGRAPGFSGIRSGYIAASGDSRGDSLFLVDFLKKGHARATRSVSAKETLPKSRLVIHNVFR